jgi:hypothetical protein
MAQLRLRLFDGLEWSEEFTATSAANLVLEVRRAWLKRVAFNLKPRLGEGVAVLHPEVLLNQRLAEIDAWAADQKRQAVLAHLDSTSVTCSAEFERGEARRLYGAVPLLALQVWVPRGEFWANPLNLPYGEYVSARPLDEERSRSVWVGCLIMVLNAMARSTEGPSSEEHELLDDIRRELAGYV